MSKRSDNLQVAKDIEHLIDRLAGIVSMVEKQPERADTTNLRVIRDQLERIFE